MQGFYPIRYHTGKRSFILATNPMVLKLQYSVSQIIKLKCNVNPYSMKVYFPVTTAAFRNNLQL